MAPMARKKAGKNVAIFLIILSFIVFGYFITRGINLPYVGYNAWNFNTYSHIAKNYFRFGFVKTRFAPIISVDEKFPEKPSYYLHHPQLLSIVMAVFYSLFGFEFWVGRLCVILASLGSLLFVFLIAKRLEGGAYAYIASGIFVFIPASSIFGRMIGQEALVLFFVLSSTYFLLRNVQTGDRLSLFATFGSIILGTLSDWPMVYFTLCLLPFLYVKRRFRLALALVGTSVITSALFLGYAFFLSGGSADFINAFLVRSPGALLSMRFWLIKWILLISLRLLIYFNPLIVVLSSFYAFSLIAAIFKRRLHAVELLFLGFLAFGVVHVLLYPEGSFGHAYWIYYLLPFVCFSASKTLLPFFLRRKFAIVFLFFFFAGVYGLVIDNWKVNEVRANVFRYALAEKADRYLRPYEALIINENGVIDPDLLSYTFSHEVKVVSRVTFPQYKDSYNHYLYSCINRCGEEDIALKALREQYRFVSAQVPEAEVYIFSLQEKNEENYSSETKIITAPQPFKQSDSQESILRRLYREIKQFLQAPQI